MTYVKKTELVKWSEKFVTEDIISNRSKEISQKICNSVMDNKPIIMNIENCLGNEKLQFVLSGGSGSMIQDFKTDPIQEVENFLQLTISDEKKAFIGQSKLQKRNYDAFDRDRTDGEIRGGNDRSFIEKYNQAHSHYHLDSRIPEKIEISGLDGKPLVVITEEIAKSVLTEYYKSRSLLVENP